MARARARMRARVRVRARARVRVGARARAEGAGETVAEGEGGGDVLGVEPAVAEQQALRVVRHALLALARLAGWRTRWRRGCGPSNTEVRAGRARGGGAFAGAVGST